MKKITITAAIALVVVPSALAGPSPTSADRARAVGQCEKVRPAMNTAVTAGTFRRAFGTAARERRDAFGRCVARFTREEHQSRHAAFTACWTEHNVLVEGPTSDPAAPPDDPDNAFGECVSEMQRSESRSDRRAHVNAARACVGLRSAAGDAFGKCVAAEAQAQD